MRFASGRIAARIDFRPHIHRGELTTRNARTMSSRHPAARNVEQISNPQFGLIAEEVANVNPDLVVRDKNGEIYTVRYEAVNAMLLNEFLKAHRQIEEQGTMIAHQQKQIEALTAGLQKVSAQVQVSKPARQTVLNNQ